MPLVSPRLDDRSFDDLVAEARRIVRETCPDWTDFSAGDPGLVLVEVFAHLTEVLLYRLNRLPEKAYVEFLRLLGVRLAPPDAAAARLRFSLARPAEAALEIPRGTRVAVGRAASGSEPVVFTTDRPAVLEPGQLEVEVVAHHAELVEAELAGAGTGLPGQWVTADRPPLVAPTGDGLELVVGIEAAAEELTARVPAVRHGKQTFRIWREVESFADLSGDRFVYVADRMSGVITFAPAVRGLGEGGRGEAAVALAEVPAAGREIRLWYRRGGGPEGNVGAGQLTVLKTPVAGLTVTNPAPATGGRAAETLENALQRGPQELHSLRRAVTARDFELLALKSSGAVARSRAVTLASLWAHATPGTVEVLLVPDLPAAERPGGRVTAAALEARQSEEARAEIAAELDARRPLGTACRVSWARTKTVRVQARVVAHREEDPAALKDRVLERLYRTISPLPSSAPQGGGSAVRTGPSGYRPAAAPGWRFGQALRASHVYDILLSEPGVSYADQVRLLVDEVPDAAVAAVVADPSQAGVWYAAAGSLLFRSVNGSDGWEVAGRFPGFDVARIAPHPERPGLVAVVARVGSTGGAAGGSGGGGGSAVHLSHDSGESWQRAAETAFQVQGLAWIVRAGVPVLLMAADVGLYELAQKPGATPVQVLVDPADPDLGFYAVAAATGVRGEVSVAVAAQGNGGVFLSNQMATGAAAGSFRRIGLQGEDVRVLAVQEVGVRSFLWAGVAVGSPSETGKGALRWELPEAPEGWKPFAKGWKGGTCWALAFAGDTVFAASHQAGVLRLDSAAADPAWQAPEIGCGLPLRDAGRLLHPVRAVATEQSTERPPRPTDRLTTPLEVPEPAGPAGPPGNDRLLLAGGPQGIYRSSDGGRRFTAAGSRELGDKVTLPPTWLFCSGEHDITVVSEDDAARD